MLNVNKSKVGERNVNLIENVETQYCALQTEKSEFIPSDSIQNILDFLAIPSTSVSMESIFITNAAWSEGRNRFLVDTIRTVMARTHIQDISFSSCYTSV
jgi:hypothetical protein